MHHTSSSRRPIVTRTLAVAFIASVLSIAGPRVPVGPAEIFPPAGAGREERAVRSLGRLLPYLLRHRRALDLGMVALFVSDAFQLASPWVFKYAIDGLGREMHRSTLLLFAGALVGMAVAGGIARYYMRRLVIGASREMEYELRNDFFAKLTTLSYSYYNRVPTGDLMARATNDLNAVRMVMGPGIMYSVNTVVTLGAALALMVILSWKLTLIALIPLPLISFFMYRFGRAIHRRFEEVQAQFSTITSRAQEYLAGIRVVKAYVQENLPARTSATATSSIWKATCGW